MDDPLATLDARRLARLARRADRVRRTRGKGLHALAARVGVPARRLRLLADAWAEAGAEGLVALGPAPECVDDAAVGHADAAIEAWRQRYYPLETLEWEVWRNRITVWRVVPPADRRAGAERRPLLQLRWTDARWHLYRRAAQGEWWPVPVNGPRRAQDVDACLDEVHRDLGGRFWSEPG